MISFDSDAAVDSMFEGVAIAADVEFGRSNEPVDASNDMTVEVEASVAETVTEDVEAPSPDSVLNPVEISPFSAEGDDETDSESTASTTSGSEISEPVGDWN